ncbi:unnamed protein product [Darwinula stevensoni]|uniref:Cns1/TTC4 wheel domain-containing protein n=1 Tax=Darwinula stevensoni TaxID=69355 RepID=A0A7R8X6W4_9CRUS|nr:unnamed protein product [Darwinula stevensoni]CAG0879853.1 unnamed protein product [Darwinula stevensoni]
MEDPESDDSAIDFLEAMAKRSYLEGWNEETWEEEMEKHPAFMTKPAEGPDIPPLVEAFQQLKYDPEENTKTDLAQNYKEDGNRHFQAKKYHLAIENYTAGIKENAPDLSLNAILHANRAAAHFRLQNFRSSLRDCIEAVKLDPNHYKAALRAAECCKELHEFPDGFKWCAYARKLPSAIESKVQEAHEALLKQQRDWEHRQKKEAAEMRKQEKKERRLQKILDSQGIKFFGMQPKNLEEKVKVDDDGELHWPVVFFYPQHGLSDFIEEFYEQGSIQEHLEEMFKEPASWDAAGEYKPNLLDVYFEDPDRYTLHMVDLNAPLVKILSHPRYA